MLSQRFDQALVYAHELHRAQTRKGGSIPYIAHPLSVAALVVEHGGDEDQAIAALLHDGPEDQGGEATLDEIRARFGAGVARIVADCSDTFETPKPPWAERKRAYLAHLADSDPRSLLVSLADKVHNAEAVAEDFRALGEGVFARFNAGAADVRWYYGALAAVFAQAAPGRLSARLARAVAVFDPPQPVTSG